MSGSGDESNSHINEKESEMSSNSGASAAVDDRSARIEQRDKQRQLLHLSTEFCKVVNTQSDVNNEFLESMNAAVVSGSFDISNEQVDEFLQMLVTKTRDVTEIYYELIDINKDSANDKYEKMFKQFIDESNVVKEHLEKYKEDHQLYEEEEHELEMARRRLEEEMKLYEQKRERIMNMTRSRITVESKMSPLQTQQPRYSVTSADNNQEEADSFEIATNERRDRDRSSVCSSHTSGNDRKEWVKDLTTSLHDTFGTKKRHKRVVEPDMFIGEITEFADWEVDFDAYVEAEELTDREALRHLKRYVGGKAKQAIAGLLTVNTAESYRQCRRKLKERFCSDGDVARVFRKKLEAWPQIRYPDGEKLRDFGDFLDHIRSSMSSVTELKILNDRQQNEIISQKLPGNLKMKWVQMVTHISSEESRYPCFAEFTRFVLNQADIYMNPIMRANHNQENQRRSDGNHTRPPPRNDKKINDDEPRHQTRRNYQTNAAVQPQNVAAKRTPYCYVCDTKVHYTAECGDLAKMAHQQRVDIVRRKNLCFSCLKGNHRSKDCNRKLTCAECKKSHPTVLHDPNYKPTSEKVAKATALPNKTLNTDHHTVEPHSESNALDKNSSANQAKTVYCTSSQRVTYSMMVPVYVSAGNKEKLVYALMDNQSDVSFIAADVAKEIEASGSPEALTMLTMNAETTGFPTRYQDLRIRGYMTNNSTVLDAFEQPNIRCNKEQIPSRNGSRQLKHLRQIANNLPPELNIPIGLLIGADCPEAIVPIQSISGNKGDPFGVKTMFGWTLCGGKTDTRSHSHSSYKIDTVLFNLIENDFKDVDGEPISQQDIKFLQMLSEETKQEENGSYIMPLPFKEKPQLPNNRTQAEKRLKQLQGRLLKDQDFCKEYTEFIEQLMAKGYAERVPSEELSASKECWYIPHFGVRHPKKKKLRVVFDASAKFNNQSLNDKLLTGPDQMNNLLGILCRFCRESIAITCDVEQMFYNFKVSPEHRNYLRFLWFDDNLTTASTYRMTRHIFGATSSPAVATFGLRKIAQDYEYISKDASTFLQRDFYVDDGIASVDGIHKAKQLVKESREICAKGNLRLHKFVSNKNEVLTEIPDSERAIKMEVFNDIMQIPSQRTLGVEWDVALDQLTFSSNLDTKPLTRRGILSTIAQIYDPIGLVAPFTLKGKNILQETCRQKFEWDKPINEQLTKEWNQWLLQLEDINKVKVERHLKPESFGQPVNIELHHFSDASELGYGACTYIRMVNQKDEVHCSLLLAKSRVAPIHPQTIPRMELQGAVVATRLSDKLRQELHMQINKEYFWCDSTIALSYIKNDTTKFQTYVANRVKFIREKSCPTQWYHIPGKLNPADVASRGASIQELISSKWHSGPEFLWCKSLQEILNDQPKNIGQLEPSDREVKKIVCVKQCTTSNESQVAVENFSKWNNLVKASARVRLAGSRKKQKLKPYMTLEPLSTELLETTEEMLIKMDQEKFFRTEIEQLKAERKVAKNSKIVRFTPYLDDNKILRVGSRASKSATLTSKEVNPAIISKKSHIAQLLVDHFHCKVHHQGRLFTQSAIRQAGYYIIGAQDVIKTYIRNCITCKIQRGKAASQKMGELPAERVEPSPPFTHIGIDTFGHFIVKERRTELKRWCIVFTCMYSRSVHIEVVSDLSTDSFLQALRCLECIRGPVKTIYSDAGTNFMGAKTSLEENLKKMDDSALKQHLAANKIVFKTNTPGASHQGGVWERIIRTIRAIFNQMKGRYNTRMDTATLRTAMYEITSIINSKPLTTTSLDNPEETVITPNHLLTMKSRSLSSLPGTFTDDVYGRSMLRKSQEFAEEFWKHWQDYLIQIESRQKWNNPKENVKVGDIVSIIDENSIRNQWRVGVVEAVKQGKDNLVRSVVVRVADHTQIDKVGKRTGTTRLERPVQKINIILRK